MNNHDLVLIKTHGVECILFTKIDTFYILIYFKINRNFLKNVKFLSKEICFCYCKKKSGSINGKEFIVDHARKKV